MPLLRSVPFVTESPLFPWPIDLALVATVAEQVHSGAVPLRLAAVVFDILLVVSKTHVAEPFAASLVVAELQWKEYSVFKQVKSKNSFAQSQKNEI